MSFQWGWAWQCFCFGSVHVVNSHDKVAWHYGTSNSMEESKFLTFHWSQHFTCNDLGVLKDERQAAVYMV